MTYIIGKKRPRKWDVKAILADAKKYNTRSEWLKNSAGAYYAASKYKIRERACAHMLTYVHKGPDQLGDWT